MPDGGPRAARRCAGATVTLGAATAAVLAGGLPPADAPWHVVPTPGVTVIGNADAESTRRLGEALAAFDAVLATSLPRGDAGAERPAVVFAFESRAALRRYWPDLPRRANGLYVAASLTDYLLVDIGSSAGYGPLFHEYVHRVSRDAFGPLPAWVDEGLAYYFQAWERDGGAVALGGPVAGLADALTLPLDELFAADARSPLYTTKRFASSARAATHYLLATRDDGALELGGLLRSLRDDPASVDVVTASCACTLAQLAATIEDYVQTGGLRAHRLPLSAPAPGATESARPLERAELLVRLGELRREAAADTDGAATLFEAALAEAPDHAGAIAGLALIAYARGDLVRADALARDAVRADPGEPRAQFAVGQSAMAAFAAWRRERQDGEQVRHPHLLAAREGYGRAAELEPSWSAAWNGFARTFLFDPETRQPGIAACERRLAAGRDAALALTLVQLYSEDGNRVAAHATRQRHFPAGHPLPGPHDLASGALAVERVEAELTRADMLLAERLFETSRPAEALEVVVAARRIAPEELRTGIDEQIARFGAAVDAARRPGG